MKSQPQSDKWVEFGPFRFDNGIGKLDKQGTPIRLRGMPLKILQHLVEHPGEVVSRGELKSLLWNGTAFGDFEQGLNTAVNVVRKTLGDSADQPRYIETVQGQGYRFIAPLRSAEPVPEMMAADSNQKVEGAREKTNTPKSRWWIAAALAIAAFGGAAWWTFQSKPLALSGGVKLSANREANDQYELAMNFLVHQNDIPLARKTFERAVELDPHFASARL